MVVGSDCGVEVVFLLMVYFVRESGEESSKGNLAEKVRR